VFLLGGNVHFYGFSATLGNYGLPIRLAVYSKKFQSGGTEGDSRSAGGRKVRAARKMEGKLGHRGASKMFTTCES